MSGGSDIAGTAGAAPGSAPRARLDWVDALKGVGILAVVAGHVWTRGPVRDAIYVFHMPLFFILSGYTARHIPWRQLVPRLSRNLLVPFISFSILLLGADFLIEGLRSVRPIFPSWSAGATTILFATEQLRGPFTILWFIPCLFLARLGWNFIAKPGRNPDDWQTLLAMLLIFALALAAQFHGNRSPFGLLAVPGALLLIWGGALWRVWTRPLPAAGLAFALIAMIALAALPPINMKMGDLGWPGLSLIGAGAVTVTLARLLQQLPADRVGALALLGRASLVIMYVHVAFIHYLAPYASKPFLFAVAMSSGWALDWLIRRSALTRVIFFGKVKNAN